METHYDYILVVVSYVIAVIAGYTGLNLSHLVKERRELSKHNTGLLTLGSITMGLGIWAMHFIAMLAYTIEVPIYYNLSITLISVIPAIAASFLTLRAMAMHVLTTQRLIGYGLLIGLGIGTMHYIGMAAMIHEAISYYHTTKFIFSLLLAWMLGILTLYFRFSPWMESHIPPALSNIVTALLWGAAVAGMHYSGMAAIYFIPGLCLSSLRGVSSEILMFPVILSSFIIILGTLIFLKFQYRLLSLNKAATINQERLLEAIDEMSDGYMLSDASDQIDVINSQFEDIHSRP